MMKKLIFVVNCPLYITIDRISRICVTAMKQTHEKQSVTVPIIYFCASDSSLSAFEWEMVQVNYFIKFEILRFSSNRKWVNNAFYSCLFDCTYHKAIDLDSFPVPWFSWCIFHLFKFSTNSARRKNWHTNIELNVVYIWNVTSHSVWTIKYMMSHLRFSTFSLWLIIAVK